MDKRKGFTLIELLVVIAIIALLLSIIVPALRKTKEQAHSVMCMSNLKQWGNCYQMYAAENDNMYMPANWGGNDHIWMMWMQPYYEDIHDLRLCPAAAKPSDVLNDPYTSGWWGTRTMAWVLNDAFSIPVEFKMGSYVENYYIKQADDGFNWGEAEDYWGSPGDKGSNKTPILLDGRWFDFGPDMSDPLPVSGQLTFDWKYADMAAMKRHGQGVNMLYMDGTVIRIDAEQLWNVKWHRTYSRRGTVDLTRLDPNV